MSILAIVFTIFFLIIGAFSLIEENALFLIFLLLSAMCVIIYELGRIIEILQKNDRL